MSIVEAAAPVTPAVPATGLRRTRRALDRAGDRLLGLLTSLAALLSTLLLVGIAWQLIGKAMPAIRAYGIGFVWESAWRLPTPAAKEIYGAREFLIGTLVTSFGAVLIAAPLSVAIALFLSELAPPRIRGPIGSLVDMLAAVPSVVIGLWGILVLGPFVHSTIEPWLNDVLGWIPIFGSRAQAPESVFTAMLVLAIMATPIISSICRELFANVPKDLQEAAIGLGATRWEMVRGVVLPSVRGGIVAATILGLGRALGEAIAVTQVVGGVFHISASLFQPGTTLASQLAAQYSSNISPLNQASLIYLGLILLVITFGANFSAQWIVRQFDRRSMR
ncbi:MAG TPA: phosphate ABC transporter permease subunit PstC [Gaiellaceae bacterium]